jgi:copper homeostasis protein CutC
MTLEICVDDIDGLDSAITGGADRIELCAALASGGLTPPPSLIAAARTAPIPVHMLVRPRAGGFRYNAREREQLAADITAAAEAGLAGVAIGASTQNRTLDEPLLADLVRHAVAQGATRKARLSLTLHRAFDLSPDLPAALDTAIELGFDRVLTSGGEPRALDGLATLRMLHQYAEGRIIVLAGSGIDASNAALFLKVGLRELHASCGSNKDAGSSDDEARERLFGFVAAGHRHTDVRRVRELKAVLTTFDRQAA